MRKSIISAPVGFMPKGTTTKQAKSGIIYQGPSLLDGKPIVVIATLTDSNDKTGETLQTYIIRADIDPMAASRTGEDYSICGTCKHRGTAHNDNTGPKQALDRSCYVLLWQGPTAVYRAYKKGLYRDDVPLTSLGRGRFVRLGSYGDPACVPATVWQSLLSGASGHTGYTHQAKTRGAKVDYSTMMVSADTKQQASGYHLNGKRTFRVIPVAEWEAKGNAAMLKTEILCPASKEAGARVQCNTCQLCSGTPTIEGYTKAMEQKIKEKQNSLESALSGVVDTATIENLKAKIMQKEKAKPLARLRKIKSIAIVAHGTAKAKV